MPEEAKNPVKSVEKTIRLIKAIRGHGSVRITELSEELGMSKGAVHNHLSTLNEYGYVVKEGDEYRLSLKFLNLGGYLRKQLELYRIAEAEVQRLANESNELVNLMTEESGKGIHLYRSKGNTAVNLDTYAGLETHLHTTALGKAILAYLSEEYIEEVIDNHGLPARTASTITDRGELFEELETIREHGYALDDEEHLSGLRCVAAPIKTSEGRVLGSISISAPTNRLKDERLENEIVDMVRSAANVIELNRGYE